MLHTTFAKAHEAEACIKSYKMMSKALGGITKYGKNTPIPLDKVVEVCGLQDALWALRCTAEDAENFIIEFACRCAEHTLHFFEDKYPDDKRPRQAIEAARVCITDKSEAAKSAARSAAESAAWSAARSAARSAESAAWSAGSAARSAGSAAWSARSAAWSAGSAAWSAARSAAESAARSAAESAAWSARSAERDWQTQQFLEILRKG